MFFIHIATLSDADDFVSWMHGRQRVACLDKDSFCDWLENRRIFPLEFYLNGITYRFCTKHELSLFQIGFEAALRIR